MIGSWAQIEAQYPLWLAALAVLLPVVYFALRSLVRFSLGQRAGSLLVRALVIVLVVLALCGIRQTYLSREPFVVVAVDQSLSVSDAARRQAEAFLDELEQRAGPGRIACVPFAARPGLPTLGKDGCSGTDDDRAGTDLAAAVRLAARLLPRTYVPQIVVLSDGNQTTGDALAAARQAGVPVSTVPLPGLPEHEVYVAEIAAPQCVRAKQPFDVEVIVRSAHDEQGTLILNRGTESEDRQLVQARAGENRFHFTTAVADEGWCTCCVRLEGFPDTLSGNNRLSAAVFVLPGPRVLAIEGRPGMAERLAAALRKDRIEVDVFAPGNPIATAATDLAVYDLILLLNVPAARLPQPWMEAVHGCVHDRGCGLIVVGGDQAFTPGGYMQTRLEDVLPVSSWTREKKDQPGLAMVIVIDRSESMQGQRIELAREATRRAVGMLGPRDQVGVIAFEDNNFWAVPLAPAADKQKLLDAVAKIQAEGQTNMYPALEKAYLALHEAFAGPKHMIVLTDGLSQAGDFLGLVRRIADSGITVSTLGVGREVAGPLLADIARIGHGRYYPCEDARAVPQIFAMETISAGKLGISEGPFLPKPAGAAPMLAGIDLGHLPALLGYAETRAKPQSEVLLTSEAGDPVLAWWKFGRGTSAAFTSTTESRWAAAWLEWPQYDRFWLQLVRHTMRNDDPRWHPSAADRRAHLSVPYAAELRLQPTNTDLLRAMAQATGGRYDPHPADVLAPDGRSVPRTALWWASILAAAVPLFFLDVLLRRLDLSPRRRKDSG